MVDKKAADSNLNNDQRRNLAHIAKILQFAASKKGFATDSPHLEALNPFIIECHEKFKLFFAECCQVIIFQSPSSYIENTIVVFLYAHWIALVLHFCSVLVVTIALATDQIKISRKFIIFIDNYRYRYGPNLGVLAENFESN